MKFPLLFTLAGLLLLFAPQERISAKTFQIREEPATPYDCGYQDGVSTQAKFCNPYDLTSDGINLFVSDMFNHVIRKIVMATGAVTTLAGTGGSFGSVDSRGPEARFWTPRGITIDHQGKNLYVADTGNHTIRKIVIATGEVSTLAGNSGHFGVNDGPGGSARFNEPVGITIDPTDSWLYLTDSSNHAVRKIQIATGTVTTFAGRPGYLGFENGLKENARFDHPSGVTIDHAGKYLYVTDTSNQAVRKISIETGAVTTITGRSGNPLFFPQGLTLAQTDTFLYIADTGNHAIQRFDVTKEAVLVYDLTADQSPLSPLPLPQGVYFDHSSNSIIFTDKKTNSIAKLNPASKTISTLAGPPIPQK